MRSRPRPASRRGALLGACIAAALVLSPGPARAQTDPLPSWNDGAAKKIITDFVARFAGIVHHTDAEREWAYDRKSHVGKLDKALDEGTRRTGPSST